MFSKPRHQTEQPPQTDTFVAPPLSAAPAPAPVAAAAPAIQPAPQPKAKAAVSVLSSDIVISGNVRSSGDIQVEGNVEGDIRCQTLIVGETATIKGEIVAEEVLFHGRVIGRLRGLKVRLSTNARVEGDIIHKSIAIESGAHFEGSVQRQDDPVGKASGSAQSGSHTSAAQRVIAAATAAAE